jgi:hypothetical protein
MAETSDREWTRRMDVYDALFVCAWAVGAVLMRLPWWTTPLVCVVWTLGRTVEWLSARGAR